VCRLPAVRVLARILWTLACQAGCPIWTLVTESGAVLKFSCRIWNTLPLNRLFGIQAGS